MLLMSFVHQELDLYKVRSCRYGWLVI